MEKKKISFCALNTEITRRCNIACAHCLRGEAQNIDMSKDVIDKLMDKTKSISVLSFSGGGEPLLNISGMRDFLYSIKERHIPLYSMHIVTNGIIKSQDYIDLMYEYHDYISQFVDFDTIVINISVDKYHEKFTDSLENFQWFKDNMPPFCNVFTMTNLVKKTGRASNLKEAIEIHQTEDTKVGYFTNDDNSFPCIYMKHFENLDDDEIVLPCKLCLTYDGSIITGNHSYDYIRNNKPIFTCDTDIEDIVKSIKEYNKGKPYCQCTWALYELAFPESAKALREALEIENDENSVRGNKGKEILGAIDALNYTEGNRISTQEALFRQWSASDTIEKFNTCAIDEVWNPDLIWKRMKEMDRYVGLMSLYVSGEHILYDALANKENK